MTNVYMMVDFKNLFERQSQRDGEREREGGGRKTERERKEERIIQLERGRETIRHSCDFLVHSQIGLMGGLG